MGYAFRFAPNISAVPITQSDSTVYHPPIRAIEIWAAGSLTVRTPAGQIIQKDFPAQADGGQYPHLWELPIDQVLDTGTDIDDNNMLGYRE